MSKPVVSIELEETPRGTIFSFESGEERLTLSEPILVATPGQENQAFCYDEVVTSKLETVASAEVVLPGGTRVTVRDAYSLNTAAQAVRLRRHVEVREVGSDIGLQIGFSATTAGSSNDASAWQFYVPGALYNRNDSDCDGVEDYLGTLTHEHRDDYNAALVVMAWNSDTKQAFSLARTSIPSFDAAVTDEELRTGIAIEKTDIGSLGILPDGDQVVLRARYPFSEEVSYSLDAEGTGWAGFLPVTSMAEFDVDYELRVWDAPSLTDAIWLAYNRQRSVLDGGTATEAVTLSEVVDLRMMLTQLYYRQWTHEEDPLEPAGYLVHFSPRDGKTLGSLIEFGFSGDQALLAYTQLKWGYREAVPLYRQRACKVLDFFVRAFQEENGFAHGIYDPIHHKFTHWFTGILMPFQYAEGEDVREYVGEQVYDAIGATAEQLRNIEGNYLRTMCESFFPLLLSYELEKEHGNDHSSWLAAGEKFGKFLLGTQASDGSWYRGYSPDGTGLTSPSNWFGASYLEQKSGTIFPIATLAILFRITGEDRYRESIEKAADFIIATYIDPVVYVGGLNDTTHVKSVKTDSVGVMFVLRSMRAAYEATGNEQYLQAAVKAAKILASWVYLWNVPFPEETLLDEAAFETKGWVACDVLPAGAYLDNEFLEFTGDLVAVAKYSSLQELLEVAEMVEHGMQHGVSTPNNPHGYVASGIQCEGIMTGYWLSRPHKTEFSGAVAKRKGDDNDTCNALTNGQAAYGIFELEDTFGSSDFNVLRESLFQES